VGIDIRQGMQYACIDCGACIDACDEVMEKVNQPKGLIRFSNELNQHWTDLFKNRKNLIGYSFLFIISILGFVLQVMTMEKFDAHLTRDRSQLFFYTSEGHIQNAYIIKLHNKTSSIQTFNISVSQLHSESTQLTLNSRHMIKVSAGSRKVQTLLVNCNSPCTLESRTSIIFEIKEDLGAIKNLDSVYFSNP
jgi:polyferredoxin